MAGLFHTGVGPSLITCSLLSRVLQDRIRPIDYPSLQAVTKPAVHIESFMPLFVRSGDFRVGTWFAVEENLDVDVLWLYSSLISAVRAYLLV